MEITIDLEHESHIPDYFQMYFVNCEGSLDFINAENVTKIGQEFLREAHRLVSIDLTPLKNVTKVGDCFLAGCPSLKEIKWPDTPFWNEQRKIYENNH